MVAYGKLLTPVIFCLPSLVTEGTFKKGLLGFLNLLCWISTYELQILVYITQNNSQLWQVYLRICLSY